MMLRLLVPFMPDETPGSFCARLAIRNACHSAREFCRLLGLNFLKIVNGDPQSLSSLADISGVDQRQIASNSIRRLDRVFFSVNGESITRDSMRRVTVRICPHCLSDDISAGRSLGNLAAFQRMEWQLSFVRRCHLHGTSLVDVAYEGHHTRSHDFGVTVLSQLGNLSIWLSATQDLPPSCFEDYVRRRIRRETQSTVWLDHFPLYAVTRLCETVGVLSRFGPKTRLFQLSEADLHAACNEGFLALEDGSSSLGPLVSRLTQPFWTSNDGTGLKALFGELYEWLANEPDPEYHLARETIRAHVLNHLPFEPGEKVFGQIVETRRLWSAQSAAVATDQNPKRLRRLLIAGGFIPADTNAMSDKRVVFPANEETDAFLSKVKGAMNFIEVGQYMGAPRVQTQMIIADGLLTSFVPDRRDIDAYNHAFAKEDVDAFLLGLNGTAVCSDLTGLVDIPTALKKSHTSAAFIIRLLLAGKLTRVGRDPSRRGYMAIMLDPREVRSHFDAVPGKGLAIRQTTQITRWSEGVVKALVANGHLKSTRHGKHVRVDRQSLDAFQKEFVSLFQLADERGYHFNALKKRLSSVGVLPVFDSSDVPATFYLRRDVDTAIGLPP